MPIIKKEDFIGFKDELDRVLCADCARELNSENLSVIAANKVKGDEMVICDRCGTILHGEK